MASYNLKRQYPGFQYSPASSPRTSRSTASSSSPPASPTSTTSFSTYSTSASSTGSLRTTPDPRVLRDPALVHVHRSLWPPLTSDDERSLAAILERRVKRAIAERQLLESTIARPPPMPRTPEKRKSLPARVRSAPKSAPAAPARDSPPSPAASRCPAAYNLAPMDIPLTDALVSFAWSARAPPTTWQRLTGGNTTVECFYCRKTFKGKGALIRHLDPEGWKWRRERGQA
ncbi:hypothetical protein MIND_00572200 [Mycena indigotica]|uniref:Uncharacterized protein n=1 Tax=Mycena indigotica TaxID=2126181 RepID=A0A8H6W5C4_9AGAR|nr:uncharacterized protein MIND_00572200 [Mycena indigotica]KAF7303436.1 hypothetical protein MIND_00572200 [Mycena indigotica]